MTLRPFKFKETAHQIISLLKNEEHDELSSLVKKYENRLKNKNVTGF